MTDPRRAAEIAKIHVAKKELRLDDDVYRSILERVTGKSSSSKMNARERGMVLAEFRRLGFNARTAEDAKRARPDRSIVARKIRACWLDLKDAGVLRDSSEKALCAFVKNLTGNDSLGWLTPAQANQVIEALKSWHQREARKDGSAAT
jgi:phage gp16-like protein